MGRASYSRSPATNAVRFEPTHRASGVDGFVEVEEAMSMHARDAITLGSAPQQSRASHLDSC
jgi:hypothetical protein